MAAQLVSFAAVVAVAAAAEVATAADVAASFGNDSAVAKVTAAAAA
jgi:hypothetical protein